MTAVAKKTVMRVLVEIGEVCEAYQDRVFRNLKCRRIHLMNCDLCVIPKVWSAEQRHVDGLTHKAAPHENGLVRNAQTALESGHYDPI